MESRNYVDFKVSLWRRAHFTDDADMQVVKDMIKNGDFESTLDEVYGFDELIEDLENSEDIADKFDIIEDNNNIFNNY